MIQIYDKKSCCGCCSCYNICPKDAIKMTADEEGFLYPSVLIDKCINCGRCEVVCPVLHNEVKKEKTESYIVRYKDEKIVEESTSGGAFSAFALPLIKRGWTVYGAGYDADMKVVCKKTETADGLREMRGSKFVQSYIGTTYKEIRKELYNGRKIIFSGTPCQVSGLLNYLGKDYGDNLICIDFVCRGVPSPGLWKNYVVMMEKKYGSKMIGARFKHKTYGYHTSTMKIDFANGKTYYGSGRVDPYMKAFVKEMSSRPSCSACVFKGIERRSDITVFDCYEYTKITGKADDDKGWSSIFIHTDKGRKLMEMCAESLICMREPIENLVTENGIMVCHSAKPNKYRDKFYGKICNTPIDKALQEFMPISKMDYLFERSKQILYKTGLIQIKQKLKRKSTVNINE